MKPLITIILLIVSSFQIKQETSLDTWIQAIVNDMIKMNDLDTYNHKPIASSVEINFFLVESVKGIKIEEDIITMLINHGKGTYCTQLKFRYIKKDGLFYLVFPEPYKTTIFDKAHDFVNPWIEKINICK